MREICLPYCCNFLLYKQRGVRSGDVMQKDDLIHLPVRPNPYKSLFKFSYICPYRSELIVAFLRIPLTRFLHCTIREAVAVRPLREPVANILFTASIWWTQSPKWAKSYGVLTTRASQMLTFLSRTRAFGTVCLVRTSTKLPFGTATVLNARVWLECQWSW